MSDYRKLLWKVDHPSLKGMIPEGSHIGSPGERYGFSTPEGSNHGEESPKETIANSMKRYKSYFKY